MAISPSDPQVVGKWKAPFNLENCAIHTHLLPTGKVLYWGRRTDLNNPSMDQHSTDAFLLDPATGTSQPTAARPKLLSGDDVNLFCSGHCFQSDGKLFIVGGHLTDGDGVNQTCIYDPNTDTWTAKPLMNNGRWYPSAITMSDGGIFIISGQFNHINNHVPQLWRNNAWSTVATDNLGNAPFPLYPQLHLGPNGRVFVAGPNKQSQFLTLNSASALGTWTTNGPPRNQNYCDYGP